MTCVAATLYGVSGILETIGLVVTFADIRAARKRVVEFLTRTRHVSGYEAVPGVAGRGAFVSLRCRGMAAAASARVSL